MDIKVNTNISKEFENIAIKVEITAPELSEELQKVIDRLYKLSSVKEDIVATNGNEIFLLKAKDVIFFYSDEKNNYAKTKEGTYKIKEKLYELEETLEKRNFIRISNSCIINMEKTRSFDVSKVGSLIAKMEDNTNQEVAKRRIKNVMNFLNERK